MQIDAANLLTLFYVAVFPSTVAYLCFNRGVQLIGANRAAPFFHVIPVFGAAMAIAFLGEQPQLFHLIGFALVLTGVFVASRKPGRRPPARPSPAGLARKAVTHGTANALSLAAVGNWIPGMKSRASSLMIGTLTLVLIAGGFGALLGYKKFAGIQGQMPLRVIFEGSASGLQQGRQRQFRRHPDRRGGSLKLDNPAAWSRWR